jgi:hypothetical protein
LGRPIVVCDFFRLGDGDEVAEAPEGQRDSEKGKRRRRGVERRDVRLEMSVAACMKEGRCDAQDP